jgi:hypothetical protein
MTYNGELAGCFILLWPHKEPFSDFISGQSSEHEFMASNVMSASERKAFRPIARIFALLT